MKIDSEKADRAIAYFDSLPIPHLFANRIFSLRNDTYFVYGVDPEIILNALERKWLIDHMETKHPQPILKRKPKVAKVAKIAPHPEANILRNLMRDRAARADRTSE